MSADKRGFTAAQSSMYIISRPAAAVPDPFQGLCSFELCLLKMRGLVARDRGGEMKLILLTED